jgi:septal ring factor EnvC (AmiA/AmiB activator)
MTERPSKWMALLVAVGCLSAAGCGSTNPPCPVTTMEVDRARVDATEVESKLAALRQEKARLEQQIASEESRRAELEKRKAEIEARIAELGG